MRRKNVIVCRSAEEMEHKAETLQKQGFRVEIETRIQPVAGYCFETYQVFFW